MKAQFELEQGILNCWNIVDDISVVNEYLLEHAGFSETKEVDKISNMLIGLESLYQVKFEKVFSMFEQVIREQYKAKQAAKVTWPWEHDQEQDFASDPNYGGTED